jgi:diacylglycerol kinase (ATP)
MKHIFVINPAAGKRDGRQKIYEMAEMLRVRHGLDAECVLTRNPGHATQMTRKIAESGEQVRFYACGGDGTINEVANGIIGFENAAMSCIPIGTGNDFLKNFGEDAAKFSDAENLWDGPQFPLDAIDCNGRIAMTIACSGIDARVASDVHKFSESPILDGKSSYVASLALNFLFKGIASHWTVELDGVANEDDFSLISVCNGRYYGGGFMPVPEARMNDGVLDVIVVKKVNRRTFVKFVTPYSKGQYYKFPHLASCSNPKVVHIHSKRSDIVTCLDGECVTNSDVVIRMADKKVLFFGPVGCDCNKTAQ